MPVSRNEGLFKQITDFIRGKVGDSFSPNILSDIVPTINLPIPPRIVRIRDDPAVAAGALFTPPTGKLWKFIMARMRVDTDANAANRTIQVVVHFGTDVVFVRNALNTMAANQIDDFFITSGDNEATETAGTQQHIPVPSGLWLSEDMDLSLEVGSAQAGDQVSLAFIIVEEYDV